MRLRIVVTNPPAGTGTRFGVQDKSGAIHAGVQAMHAVVFECEVRASDGPEPNFLGPFAHGPPKARFIYVSHQRHGAAGWIKRIKVPLSSITWSMVAAARDGALETEVDGRSSGTVAATWRPIS